MPFLCTHDAYEVAVSSVEIDGLWIGVLVVSHGERGRLELSTGRFPEETKGRAVEQVMGQLGMAFAIGRLPRLLELSSLLAVSKPELVGSALDRVGSSRESSWTTRSRSKEVNC